MGVQKRGDGWMGGWMEWSHPPPGGEGVIKHPSIHPATHHLSAAPPGSSNPPHSCLPPPERGVDDGDDDDALTQATSSNSKSSNKTLAKQYQKQYLDQYHDTQKQKLNEWCCQWLTFYRKSVILKKHFVCDCVRGCRGVCEKKRGVVEEKRKMLTR